MSGCNCSKMSEVFCGRSYNLRIWDHDWKTTGNMHLGSSRLGVSGAEEIWGIAMRTIFQQRSICSLFNGFFGGPWLNDLYPSTIQLGPSHPTSSYSRAQSCHSHEATQETNSPPQWDLATCYLVKIPELWDFQTYHIISYHIISYHDIYILSLYLAF